MPTSRLTTLLLLAAALSMPGTAPADSDELSPSFDRLRPGAASYGPRGVPRTVDTAVEPASFQAFAEAKPLTPAGEPVQEIDETPPLPEADPVVKKTSQPLDTVETTEPEPARLSSAADPRQPTEPKPTPDANNGRRLLGRSSAAEADATDQSAVLGANPFESLMAWRPSTQSMTATGGGLAIAVGLVLATTWLIRSVQPKSSRPLPRDVVEVLGRAPLGGKQTTQLVRVGSKLVLVAITPEGAETLTEITDPGEVARLISACDSNNGRGANAEFDAMLREMSDERTSPGFLDPRDSPRPDDTYGFDPRSLAAAYANTPGGRGDG